jgi:hypothetical protein
VLRTMLATEKDKIITERRKMYSKRASWFVNRVRSVRCAGHIRHRVSQKSIYVKFGWRTFKGRDHVGDASV